MQITADQLKRIAPAAKDAAGWVGHINAAMCAYGINTRLRVAAFLAQILHESGSLKYTREIWGPTAAQKGYEGRKDLGNTVKGDGSKFRGRGLIQTTGRTNYGLTGKALNLDLLTHPELLEQPQYAALSAGYFWDKKKLNALADLGQFELITRRVNGGLNGYAERKAFYDKALKILPV